MSDRAILFLFSLAAIVASLGASVWLVATGQAADVDGLFLLLTCLLTALAFGLYVAFLIRRALEPPKAPAVQRAAQASPAAAQTKAAPVTQS